MKARIFLILVVLLPLFAISQESKTLNLADTAKYPPAKCTYHSNLKGLSPNTAFLFRDLEQLGRQLTEKDTAIIAKYSLKQTREGIVVGAFLELSADFDKQYLSRFGIKVNVDLGSMVTVLIPIEQFTSFCRSQIVNYIDIGNRAEPLMNNAKSMTNTNQVHQGIQLPKGYYGKDVVVGIIDGGFDYTHPTFWDSTLNNFRIQRVWEQENNAGTPPQGFDYGTELTTPQEIINSICSEVNKSHGTHVAGIAAGGGTNMENLSPYKGIAPESDIVLVATTMNIAEVFEGIIYIIDYAQSVGKPCVINMSLGHHAGPHDGNSVFDRYCDTLRALYPEGVILVGAAGNDGNSNIHFATSFSANNTDDYTFVLFGDQAAGSGVIDIWGSNDFSIQLCSYNTNSDNVSGGILTLNSWNEGSGQYTNYDGDYFQSDPCYISANIQEYQGKKHIYLSINNNNQDDSYKPLLMRVYGSSGVVHMWHLSDANGFYSLNYNACLNGNDLYTCAEVGGTGNSMISVGAYTSRTSWTSIAGEMYGVNYEMNDIAPFSSIGPTTDHRIKPDITAPGAWIISSVNSFDPENYPINSPLSIDSIMNSQHAWLYGVMPGTSMAAPMVTGVMALWLEAYPELTITQAKQLIRETAINDTYTGNIDTSSVDYQNIVWGAGKIDAHGGIKRLLQKIPNRHLFNQDTIRMCSGESFFLSAPIGYNGYIWSNGDTTRTIQVSQSGNYSVRLVSSEGYKSQWSDTVAVILYPNNPPIISGNTDICQGAYTTIIVENASSILWDNGQNTNSLTISPSQDMTYRFTMTDENGCNHSDSVRINVHQAEQINLQVAICQGETYTENGFNVSEAGVYTQNLQTINGCDSTVTLTLSVNPVYNLTIDATINQGDTYQGLGFNVSEAGTYTQNLQSVNGCDSVIVLNLTVNSSLGDVAVNTIEVALYPNPAESYTVLKVQGLKEQTKVALFDVRGRKLRELDLSAETESVRLDLQDLPSGVYTLMIGNTTKKLIVE